MNKLCEDPESRGEGAEWRHRFNMPVGASDSLVPAFMLLCWKHANRSAKRFQRDNLGGFLEPLLLPNAVGAPVGSTATSDNYWAQEAWKAGQEVQSAT